MNAATVCLGNAVMAVLNGASLAGAAEGVEKGFLVVAVTDGTVAGKSLPLPVAMKAAKRARTMADVVRALVAL